MSSRPAQPAYEVGSRDSRPWGSWEVLAVGATYVVKRILVQPGGKLSLQRHQGREEHWVFVTGQGTVTLDGEEIPVVANDAVFIPVRAWHRVESTGTEPLTFIEVQVGEDLREDDIERRDDIYGRT